MATANLADADEKADNKHSLQPSDAVVISNPEASNGQEESQDRLNNLLEEHGATWDGPEDPEDPYNWSTSRKILTAVIVSVGQLITLMSTSMIAAPLATIARDLDMTLEQAQIVFSIYILGLAFGPFIIAALSEMYGRKPVWLVSNLWYIVWNSLCPVGHSKGLMTIGRFLAGAGASVGIALTAPVLTDLYRKEDRGKSLAIATFIPYFGPALGPIVGGIVSQYIRWEWLFWILSMFNGLNTVIGLLFFRETYTPTILRKKRRQLRQATDPQVSTASQVQPGKADQPFSERLKTSLLRPFLLLAQRPMMQFLALITALNFGIYCVMLSTYANLFIDRYRQSETASSLNYIAIAVGAVIASQGGGHVMDYIYRVMQARHNDQARPEFRVPFMIPPVLLFPAGLFMYGWAAQAHAPWAVVDVGAAIFTAGSFTLAQGIYAYMYDEFEHAASANAAIRWLSNVLGFAFPIFGPSLYIRLGYGWGNSVLAFVFIALGAPTPLLLWVWGPKLRAIGRKD